MNHLIEFVDGVKELTCLHCGKPSEAIRTTKTFCDLACKNAYHNKRRQRERVVNNALDSIDALVNNLPHAGDSIEYDALKVLLQKIANAMGGVEK